MPYQVIGREVVRGTITRDRWRAEVTLACNDRIQLGERADLFVNILWRAEQPEESSQPEDAAPVVLRLKSLTSEAGGAVRFDHPDGGIEKQFAQNTTALLSLYGKSASAGEIADVALEVDIEGESRGTLKLSVGTVENRLVVRAGNGTSDPPGLLVPGRQTRYQAVVQPALTGAIQWRAFPPGKLDIRGQSDRDRVAVAATADADAQRFLLAWFVEEAVVHSADPAASDSEIAAKTLVAVLPVATFSDTINTNIESAIEPDTAEVIRAGWTTELGNPGDPVELWVEVNGGQIGQKLSVEIQSVTAAGDGVPLETIEVPLGQGDRIAISWKIPAAIAEGAPEALSFTASLLDRPVVSADHTLPEGADSSSAPSQIYSRIKLQTFLEVQLIDSNNQPLENVFYQLLDRRGEPIAGASGESGADGEILLPDLPSTEYVLQIDGVTVFGATEPNLPASPPEPDNTVFSFIDVRIDSLEPMATAAGGLP